MKYYTCISKKHGYNFLYSLDENKSICYPRFLSILDHMENYEFRMEERYKIYSKELEDHEIVKYKLQGII